MPISPYLKSLRDVIGTNLVLMPGVAALIHDRKGRLLLLQRSDDGAWGLPAGAVDPGESPAAAVVREVYEETGLRVRPVALAGVMGPRRVTYPNGDQVEYTVAAFFCAWTAGELEAVDGEATGFRWCAPDELPELGVPPAILGWQPGDVPYFMPAG